MKYQWIQAHRRQWAVERQCQALAVSVSGYYGWCQRQTHPTDRAQRQQRLQEAIRQYHQASQRVYGYRRIQKDIVAAQNPDLPHHPETIRKTMRQMGLRVKKGRRFVVTTDSKHDCPVAPNVLDRDFSADAPNQKWVTDITYIPTREGWLYLAIVLDLFSRRVVGWSMSDRIDTNLVLAALNMAILNRGPVPNLIHHSDRGVQYASADYQKRLKDLLIRPSMSRKGNCWDNACAESFFGSLKNEWTYGKEYQTREEAKNDIFYYIESFYNRYRRHAYLDGMCPAEFETRYYRLLNRAAV